MKLNLLGKRFGRWTVIAEAPSRIRQLKTRNRTDRVAYWSCRCDCGAVREIATSSLKTGNSKSCGCLNREELGRRRSTHGHTKDRGSTREYRIWQAMLNRCRNPKTINYKYYGGRGIKVCERWQSFESFLADMGACPPQHSIDRIDVDSDYEPGNCRWATSETQMNNQRKRKSQRTGR